MCVCLLAGGYGSQRHHDGENVKSDGATRLPNPFLHSSCTPYVLPSPFLSLPPFFPLSIPPVVSPSICSPSFTPSTYPSFSSSLLPSTRSSCRFCFHLLSLSSSLHPFHLSVLQCLSKFLLPLVSLITTWTKE